LIESIIFIVILGLGLLYAMKIISHKNELQEQKYEQIAQEMHHRLENMILSKQKATIAMAVAIENDKKLLDDLQNNKIDKNYYDNLILKFKNNTLYKNIWIHIVDKDFKSVYKSWSDEKDKNITKKRAYLQQIMDSKKPTYTLSIGKYDIAIKAIVPILKDGEAIGVFELISHFNSISLLMKKFDIDSIVLVREEFKKNLTNPFTNIFLDEKYYVSNFDAPKYIKNYLTSNGVENYFTNSYKIENSFIIVSHELKRLDGKVIGYYIMFKKLSDVSTLQEEYFMFRWFTLGLLIILMSIIVLSTTLFYANKKQKKYYKQIIDSSTNIVIINDLNSILDVNKVFFKYFYDYKSIDEFKQKHRCICEFFVHEDGYLENLVNNYNWVKNVVENGSKDNKVKIKYYESEYYFIVNASLICSEKKHYSIVFTDITNEEINKKKLEKISITDSLTQINNRYFFDKNIKKELYNANRYSYSISLIMLDIDFFKKVNDEHGHDIGDKVLVEYTRLISSNLRQTDIFSRVGGEEFIIVLPHVKKEDALAIAQKLRKEVQQHKKVLPITMSFGVIEYKVDESVEDALKRVDIALYKAKESGRNRVEEN
jgi:diguanylate cyclase (GGDEF)-like protein